MTAGVLSVNKMETAAIKREHNLWISPTRMFEGMLSEQGQGGMIKDLFKKIGWKRKILFLMLPIIAGYVGFEWVTYPDTAVLVDTDPKSTAWMEMRARESTERGKKPRRYQLWKPLKSISPNLKNAVLIAEDAAFFQHEGLDYSEIREAIKINAERL